MIDCDERSPPPSRPCGQPRCDPIDRVQLPQTMRPNEYYLPSTEVSCGTPSPIHRDIQHEIFAPAAAQACCCCLTTLNRVRFCYLLAAGNYFRTCQHSVCRTNPNPILQARRQAVGLGHAYRTQLRPIRKYRGPIPIMPVACCE